MEIVLNPMGFSSLHFFDFFYILRAMYYVTKLHLHNILGYGVATLVVKLTENAQKMDRKSEIFCPFSVNFLSSFQFQFVYFDLFTTNLPEMKSK